jgi:hypothetical protein
MLRILLVLMTVCGLSAGDAAALVLKEWNLRLEPEPGWIRQKGEGLVHASLRTQDSSALIEISAYEGSHTPREELDTVSELIKNGYDSSRALGGGPRRMRVAGVPAMTARWSVMNAGQRLVIQVVTFWNQGISYRIYLTRTTARAAVVDRAFEDMVDSITFPEERTAWMERHRGSPRALLMAGGLVSATLARPRWTEATIQTGRDYTTLDQASYSLLSGGAWMHVRVRTSRQDAAAELEAACARIVGSASGTVEDAVEAVPASLPGRIFDLVDGEVRTRYRVGATTANGVAVVAWMAAVEDRSEETLADWTGFVASIAWGSRHRLYDPRPREQTGLASPFAGAVQIPNSDHDEVWLSGDGAWAVCRGGGVVTRLSLADGRHAPTGLTAARILSADSDGLRTVIATGTEVILSAGGATRSLPVHASAIALIPGSSGAVVCAGPDREHNQSQLWRLDLFSGATTPVMVRPFTTWALPAVSRDGSQVAVVASDALGHSATVAVITAPLRGGPAARTVMAGIQTFRSLSWMPDGRLLAVRHAHQDIHGRSLDCFLWWTEAISAGDGTVRRLIPEAVAFSARMDRQGDLVVWPQFYNLAPSDRALHRIPARRIADLAPGEEIDARRLRGAVRSAMAGWLAGKPPESATACAEGARIAAAAWESAGGGGFPLSGTAPGDIHTMQRALIPAQDPDPILVLAVTLVHGEIMVRAGQGIWVVGAGAWGDHRPGPPPVPRTTVPWLAPYQGAWWAATDDDGFLYVPRPEQEPTLLVHPPSAAPAVVDARIPDAVRRARAAVAALDAEAAMDAYAEALAAAPGSDRIADEALDAARASGLPGAATRLGGVLWAVGGSHPPLLLAAASTQADPVPLLVGAAGHRTASAPVFRALAASASAAEPALAEMCLRRAWQLGDEDAEIAAELARVIP